MLGFVHQKEENKKANFVFEVLYDQMDTTLCCKPFRHTAVYSLNVTF